MTLYKRVRLGKVRPMDARDRFLVLKKIRYSEADLIIHALSPTGSKMCFMARGALRSKKRFGGGTLEPLHLVQLVFETTGGQIKRLKEATLINDFAGLKRDYDRLEFALGALNAVHRVSQEGDDSSQFLFNLLGHTLQALSSSTQEDWTVLRIQFWLKFLLQQGVLEVEPWMRAYLSRNIADFEQIEKPSSNDLEKVPFVQSMVEHYIKNAVVD